MKSVPPYAILSHRWGDDEVLFQDVRNGSYKEKKGFQKIEFCAKQAHQDQLHYFWVDTCCIDKWNLQELSKSINSMFRWYRDADKCYVYLQDVSMPAAADTEHQEAWIESFRHSVWFSRGWTLPELIAPKIVEFFSQEGHRMGDKVTLEESICAATSIPAEALQNRPLESFGVEERMTWAKSRTTTEPEDLVYCLLGILGVQMNVSYGEGLTGARERLQGDVTGQLPVRDVYSVIGFWQ